MTRILIVEDDEAVSTLYVDKLTGAGYDVLFAANGEEGYRKASQSHPDLILLDILLPGGMNGMDVLKKLRQESWGRNLPVIILSNLDATGDVLAGVIAHKPSYYILKIQATPEEVLQKVKEILS